MFLFLQTVYFGLRYLNKQSKFRWVELDKPLKKQIDKHALDATLYFGIMYYLANIDRLQQEITRLVFSFYQLCHMKLFNSDLPNLDMDGLRTD